MIKFIKLCWYAIVTFWTYLSFEAIYKQWNWDGIVFEYNVYLKGRRYSPFFWLSVGISAVVTFFQCIIPSIRKRSLKTFKYTFGNFGRGVVNVLNNKGTTSTKWAGSIKWGNRFSRYIWLMHQIYLKS